MVAIDPKTIAPVKTFQDPSVPEVSAGPVPPATLYELCRAETLAPSDSDGAGPAPEIVYFLREQGSDISEIPEDKRIMQEEAEQIEADLDSGVRETVTACFQRCMP